MKLVEMSASFCEIERVCVPCRISSYDTQTLIRVGVDIDRMDLVENVIRVTAVRIEPTNSFHENIIKRFAIEIVCILLIS